MIRRLNPKGEEQEVEVVSRFRPLPRELFVADARNRRPVIETQKAFIQSGSEAYFTKIRSGQIKEIWWEQDQKFKSRFIFWANPVYPDLTGHLHDAQDQIPVIKATKDVPSHFVRLGLAHIPIATQSDIFSITFSANHNTFYINCFISMNPNNIEKGLSFHSEIGPIVRFSIASRLNEIWDEFEKKNNLGHLKYDIEKFKNMILDPYPPPDHIREKCLELTNDSDLTPYPFQLRNVGFINEIENLIDIGSLKLEMYPVVKKPKYVQVGDNVYYNVTLSSFVRGLSEENLNHPKKEFNFRGGCLFDEVGLGKTLSILLATAIRGPRSQHRQGGTLIIIPPQTVSHWKSEIKSIMPSAIVLTVQGKRDYDRLKINDIKMADFVIWTTNFLDNNVYKSPVLAIKNSLNGPLRNYQYAFPVMGAEYCDFSTKEDPVFVQGIYWNRLIVDECHEMLKHNDPYPSYKMEFISNIQSDYVWILTGTPYTFDFEREQIDNILRILVRHEPLKQTKEDDIKIEKEGSLNIVNEWFFQNLVVRHTKKSIDNEIHLPPVIENVVELEFLPTERMLYNHLVNRGMFLSLSEATCHPQIHSFATDLQQAKDIGEVQHIMTKQLKTDLCKDQKKLEIAQMSIDYCLSRLQMTETRIPEVSEMDEPTDEDAEIQIEDERQVQARDGSLTRSQKSYIMAKKIYEKVKCRIDEIKRSITFLESICSKDFSLEKCCICLEDMSGVVAYTICGHVYCLECIDNWVGVGVARCPTCRKELERNDLIKLQSCEINTALDIRQKIGTKMAALLDYIDKKPKDHKMVLFIQSENVLRKTIKLFHEYHINHVSCTGNFYQKSSAIERFKTDPGCRLIILSAISGSSGTNLTEASEIIFLDPLVGDEGGHQKRLETQAVARVHRLTQKKEVVLTKFIIKRTIEDPTFE